MATKMRKVKWVGGDRGLWPEGTIKTFDEVTAAELVEYGHHYAYADDDDEDRPARRAASRDDRPPSRRP